MRHTHFLEIDLQAQGIPTCTYRGQVWRAQAQGLPEEDRARGEGGDARLRVAHVRHLPTGPLANHLGASSPRRATLGGILVPRMSTTFGVARIPNAASYSPSPSRYSEATPICSLVPTHAAVATNPTTSSPCDSTRTGTLAAALVPTQTRAIGGTHRIII
jgi:hypothetical protein